MPPSPKSVSCGHNSTGGGVNPSASNSKSQPRKFCFLPCTWWAFVIIPFLAYVLWMQHGSLAEFEDSIPLTAAKTIENINGESVSVVQFSDKHIIDDAIDGGRMGSIQGTFKGEDSDRDSAIQLDVAEQENDVDEGIDVEGSFHYESIIRNHANIYSDSRFAKLDDNQKNDAIQRMKVMHNLETLNSMQIDQRFPEADDFALVHSVVLASLAHDFVDSSAWLDGEIPEDDDYFKAEHKPALPLTVFRPFATRLIIPKETRIVVFGDVHGSLEGFLASLRDAHECIDEDTLVVKEWCRVLFLGDFVDRGERSVEVIYVIMLLRAVNGNRVNVVRGNHEDVNMCIHYGLGAEMTRKYNDNRSFVLGRVLRLFQFLPSVVYLGVADGEKTMQQNHTNKRSKVNSSIDVVIEEYGSGTEDQRWFESKEAVVVSRKNTHVGESEDSNMHMGINATLVHFMQCSHGVIEWGYIPTRLLKAPHSSAVEGAEFKHQLLGTIDRESTLIRMKDENKNAFSYIMRMMKQDPQLLKSFSGSFVPTSPSQPRTLGVCWTDLMVKGSAQYRPPFVFVPNRGVAFDVTLLQSHFSLSSTSGKSILHGVIRGHQHNDAAGPMLSRLLNAHGAVDIYGGGDGDDADCPEVGGSRLPDDAGYYWIMTMISASEAYLGLDSFSYALLNVSNDWNKWVFEHKYKRIDIPKSKWRKCTYGPSVRHTAVQSS
eukprot:CFRG6410T1